MQFKHPEILYALFLLIIPIIVHLFQLRRYKKVAFTNVKFLKKVEQNTRKSSKLKKFLILCTRLLALAGLILAFAQPYLSSIKKESARNTYIYIDNSLSMQAKGNKGSLLKRTAQDIAENYASGNNVNLITNNKFLKNITAQDLKKELLSLEYHPIAKDINTTLFKIKNSIKKNSNKVNEVVLISDFQEQTKLNIDSVNNYNIIQLAPVKVANVSIDSIYISDQNSDNITLKALVKSYNAEIKNLAISLYNGTILQGKSNINLTKNATKSVDFIIPNTGSFNGKLTIDLADLPFDNELYFSINKEDKINVTVIGNNNEFLSKIYTNDEFNYTSYKLNQVDYSKLNEQNVIVLNELENIPTTLINSLKTYVNNSGKLVIIPNIEENKELATLFSTLQLGKIDFPVYNEVAITDINFSHPILKNVFEKQIKNFQYPYVKLHHNYTLHNQNTILKFENDKPFISEVKTQNSSVYVLAAAINKENSNFKNSPLIVPVFYNIGKQSYQHATLNYTIGNQNEIEVKTTLKKDDILQITNTEGSFIPFQQIGNASVKLSLDDQPLKSGIYQLKNKDKPIKNLAFNYNRNESNLAYTDVKTLLTDNKNVTFFDNIKNALTSIDNQYKTNNLWQVFLLIAIVFLLIEMLLLKFLKP